jgi:hypothetical protein
LDCFERIYLRKELWDLFAENGGLELFQAELGFVVELWV